MRLGRRIVRENPRRRPARGQSAIAARLKKAGKAFAREAAIAKLKGSEVAEYCTSRGLEMLDGYGYVKGYPMEKLFRDSKIGKIYEGTSFMQLNTIAKDVLKRG